MRFGLTAITAALLVLSGSACSKPPPRSIDELRAAEFSTSLEFERSLAGGPGYAAYLVSYRSSGLKIYAMVAVPDASSPVQGYPILVANHGHHPNPPDYGFTADGADARPGDYYREIPELYAGHGFLVVMPDYRGHNVSEGAEYTEGMLESSYYTEDVLTLLSALSDIENADVDNIFMWGHSMGGEVTLRALVATDTVKGATLWSSVGGDVWAQSYYYSRYQDALADDGSDVPKPVIERLREDIEALDGNYDWRGSEPLFHLTNLSTPLIIHHAIGDTGAAYEWSARLAKELYLLGHRYVFHSYGGSEHLFTGESRRQAVARDVAFFRAVMGDAPQPTDPTD